MKREECQVISKAGKFFLFDVGVAGAMTKRRSTEERGEIVARGLCWGVSPDPTIGCDHTCDGDGAGDFTAMLCGLVRNRTCYVRAYATNAAGTGYGGQVVFTTLATLPVVSTVEILWSPRRPPDSPAKWSMTAARRVHERDRRARARHRVLRPCLCDQRGRHGIQ
jgi:hypothetical protein